jgi:hypothetical protein
MDGLLHFADLGLGRTCDRAGNRGVRFTGGLRALRRERRGVSCDTELTIYRDPSGAVLAVSCGCPVDYGPTYYLLPALASQVEDKRRVWSWWNPNSYHADSYPGPGVPIEELTEGERGEVVTREQARVAMIRQERLGQIESAARMRLEDEGLIELKDKRFGKPKPCPIKAISYAVDPGPNVEAYLIDFARYKREREGDWPTLEGVDIVVQLPPEAWAKKGRKPAPVDALPRALKLSNYLNAIVRYEEVGANG